MTKKSLLKIINLKSERHVKIWDVLPDVLIITQIHYDLVKDSPYVATLRVIIEENIKSPILLKK